MKHQSAALISLVGLLLLAAACSLIRPKRPLDWQLELQVDAPQAEREAATAQTMKLLRTRLDGLAISNFELTLKSAKDGKIWLGLPAASDGERVKRLLTMSGQLEITPVISPPSPAPVQTYETEQVARKASAEGRVFPFDSDQPAGAMNSRRYVIVERDPIVSGQDMNSASAVSADGNYGIAFTLNSAGAERMRQWSGSHIDSYIAIVLNGKAISLPFIKSQLSDSGMISGRFSRVEAEDLALVLKSGNLPFAVRVVGESFIQIKR